MDSSENSVHKLYLKHVKMWNKDTSNDKWSMLNLLPLESLNLVRFGKYLIRPGTDMGGKNVGTGS